MNAQKAKWKTEYRENQLAMGISQFRGAVRGDQLEIKRPLPGHGGFAHRERQIPVERTERDSFRAKSIGKLAK